MHASAVRLAERSKAPDLSSGTRKCAWVRTPHLTAEEPFFSLASDVVEEVVGIIEELFRVVRSFVVDSSVVVNAEESSLILFDGTAGREKHTTAALLNGIT